MSLTLAIVSPCRDEEAFIRGTLDSVVGQTRRPDRWIIVDDGSTDRTAEIVAEYAARHPWIELVRSDRTGGRGLGAPVVRAFKRGLDHLGDYPWDIIAKLDCDLSLPRDAIEKHLRLFDDPAVGAAGGAVHLAAGDRLEFERYPDYFVPGQAKFYRRACYEDIGGFRDTIGWDYIDVIDARRHGWKTVIDQSIVIEHHRLMGGAHGSLRSRFRWGHATYIIGSDPLFAILKGFYRMMDRPRVVGGLAIIAGFLSGYIDPRIRRIEDAALVEYVRKEQRYRLLHGNRLPPRDSSDG